MSHHARAPAFLVPFVVRQVVVQPTLVPRGSGGCHRLGGARQGAHRGDFAFADVVTGQGPCGALQAADSNGIQLPAGFTSPRRGPHRPSGGGTAPTPGRLAPDGGACFADEWWRLGLVSNSEVGSGGGGAGAISVRRGRASRTAGTGSSAERAQLCGRLRRRGGHGCSGEENGGQLARSTSATRRAEPGSRSAGAWVRSTRGGLGRSALPGALSHRGRSERTPVPVHAHVRRATCRPAASKRQACRERAVTWVATSATAPNRQSTTRHSTVAKARGSTGGRCSSPPRATTGCTNWHSTPSS